MNLDISGERAVAPGEREQHPHLAGRLIPGGHSLVLRVYYEDTDFSGIVYHANYLKFMERGRSDYMRLLGVVQGELFAQAAAEAPGFHFVVRSMQLDFLKPARIDDVLEVVTLSKEVQGASILLDQSVQRRGEVLVRALVRVAFVSQGRARRIPDALRQATLADAVASGGTVAPQR
ncbi:MAG: tol-pal system-associated acyl-CoA thioesterase [Rhizobiales bacterium 17-65-6]|nr:MAG: tol-pal system-associated acyl-CoA thioesterase [Rhizobiales bacterium 12-68-15]OYX87748.1 MAG: tol-pal system-associated acyl-CoA thioesterase [Azorhizobium sp. 32-67-21]OYY12436.1 MAG: tol-pal system-associated acyl-CoA thioesterase [Rhizobiales bacterium 35-68-8]OZA00427.1 MAG: tol-pal system-associated acyl-CoA thioesterase [Rhizobiales bacterium 17-65-6]OZA90907.1 MAG: tol-pal system-associated acyl-CoA thioesterase [Azorhizobium sp. 39-67-5]